jgi:hypothetical protein
VNIYPSDHLSLRKKKQEDPLVIAKSKSTNYPPSVLSSRKVQQHPLVNVASNVKKASSYELLSKH